MGWLHIVLDDGMNEFARNRVYACIIACTRICMYDVAVLHASLNDLCARICMYDVAVLHVRSVCVCDVALCACACIHSRFSHTL